MGLTLQDIFHEGYTAYEQAHPVPAHQRRIGKSNGLFHRPRCPPGIHPAPPPGSASSALRSGSCQMAGPAGGVPAGAAGGD